VKAGAVLTDNGREFCGMQERHPYELLLAMDEIEHRTTLRPATRDCRENTVLVQAGQSAASSQRRTTLELWIAFKLY